jgi:hypothetical protein
MHEWGSISRGSQVRHWGEASSAPTMGQASEQLFPAYFSSKSEK